MVEDALRSVISGQADCAVVDQYTLTILNDVRPKLPPQFRTIGTSGHYPVPVILGRREHLQFLQANLWENMRKHFTLLNNHSAGKNLARFWRFKEFKAPPENYVDEVQNAAKRTPMPMLAPNVRGQP